MPSRRPLLGWSARLVARTQEEGEVTEVRLSVLPAPAPAPAPALPPERYLPRPAAARIRSAISREWETRER